MDQPAEQPKLPEIRFVGGKPRSETVPLDWPIEVDGRLIDSIVVCRMTAGEIAAYIEQVETAADRAAAMRIRFPMFRAIGGALLPDAVIDALDDDDGERVQEVALRFLPRRFRVASTAPMPGSGD